MSAELRRGIGGSIQAWRDSRVAKEVNGIVHGLGIQEPNVFQAQRRALGLTTLWRGRLITVEKRAKLFERFGQYQIREETKEREKQNQKKLATAI